MRALGILLMTATVLFFSPSPRPVLCTEAQSAANNTGRALSVRLKGTIDHGLLSLVRRACREAEKKNYPVLLFEIDSYGGELEAALEIAGEISTVKSVRTAAFVRKKAISAGALIALSCRDIYMQPSAVIGDCAPISMGLEGKAEMLGEKIQSPLRAQFRKLAEQNGYPVKLAEAMVTQDLGVYELTFRDGSKRQVTAAELEKLDAQEKENLAGQRVIVEKGRLLTMHAREALEFGFARKLVETPEEVLPLVGAQTLTPIGSLWDEKVVRALAAVSPLLMILGFLGLWLEFKTGTGVAGVGGVLCLLLVFLGKYLIGAAQYTEVLLFLAGLGLLGLEVFVIPGFGLAGVGGITLIVAGLYLASVDFVIPQTPWQTRQMIGWINQTGLCLLITATLGFVLARLLPKSFWARRKFMLNAVESADAGFTAGITGGAFSSAKLRPGMCGTAVSDLRPAGKIRCEDLLLDAVADGSYIDRGQRIRIGRIEGNKIIVEKTE